MPIGKKFGTNEVKQIWAITYFTSVLFMSWHESEVSRQEESINIIIYKMTRVGRLAPGRWLIPIKLSLENETPPFGYVQLAVVHYFCVTIDFSHVLTIIIHDNKHIPKII